MLSDFFNLIFPRLCVNCEEVLNEDEDFLCLCCEHDFNLNNVVNVNKAFLANRNLSLNKFTALGSCMRYEKETSVQVCMHKLKYEKRREVG